MECVICKEKIGVANIFAKKCDDGCICKECRSKLPSFFSRVNEKGAARFLARTYDEENERMCRIFRETTRVGKLHFDTDHLLAVIGRINKDGTIEDGNPNIFSIANVDNFSFSTENAKSISEKKVFCDVLFTCSFLDNSWEISEVVSRGEVCFATKEDDQYFFSLPAGAQIAWDEVVRRINEKRGALSSAIDEELVTEADMSLFKAKVLFMLGDGFTKEDIEESYNRLKLGFIGDKDKISTIEQAKDTLEQYLMG